MPSAALAPVPPQVSEACLLMQRRLAGVRLEALQSFVVLADELHFTRAARRLYLTQPGLSRRISLLERQLGVELLERTTRAVALTRTGELLLPHARAMLEAAVVASLALVPSVPPQRSAEPRLRAGA